MEGRNYRAALFLTITRWLRAAAGFLERGAEAVQQRAGPTAGEFAAASTAGATSAQGSPDREAGAPPAHWLEDVRRRSRGRRIRWRQGGRTEPLPQAEDGADPKAGPESSREGRTGPHLGDESLPAQPPAAPEAEPRQAGQFSGPPAAEVSAAAPLPHSPPPRTPASALAAGGDGPASVAAPTWPEVAPEVPPAAEPAGQVSLVGPGREERHRQPPRPAVLRHIRTGPTSVSASASDPALPGQDAANRIRLSTGPSSPDLGAPGPVPEGGRPAELIPQAPPVEEALGRRQDLASSQPSGGAVTAQPGGPRGEAPHRGPVQAPEREWRELPGQDLAREVEGPPPGENRPQAAIPPQPEPEDWQASPGRWIDLGRDPGDEFAPAPPCREQVRLPRESGGTVYRSGRQPPDEAGAPDRWPSLLGELAYDEDDWEARRRALRRLERLDREQRGRLCRELPF